MTRANGSISVVIPCYCCADSLKRAVDSVLMQSLLPVEVILVDDASPDQGQTRDSIERLLETWPADIGVKLLFCFLDKNVGPGGARNAGWDLASGKYIAFLDADDSWAPKKLEMQYQWMLGHPFFEFTAHQSLHVDHAESIQQSGDIATYREIRFQSLLWKNCIPTRSVMLKNKIGFRFDSTMRYAEDYWLWLNIAAHGIRMAKLDAPLAYSYKREYGERGLSKNLAEMHAGVLKCYADLRSRCIIGPIVFRLAYLLEKLKYFKRTQSVKSLQERVK